MELGLSGEKFFRGQFNSAFGAFGDGFGRGDLRTSCTGRDGYSCASCGHTRLSLRQIRPGTRDGNFIVACIELDKDRAGLNRLIVAHVYRSDGSSDFGIDRMNMPFNLSVIRRFQLGLVSPSCVSGVGPTKRV